MWSLIQPHKILCHEESFSLLLTQVFPTTVCLHVNLMVPFAHRARQTSAGRGMSKGTGEESRRAIGSEKDSGWKWHYSSHSHSYLWLREVKQHVQGHRSQKAGGESKKLPGVASADPFHVYLLTPRKSHPVLAFSNPLIGSRARTQGGEGGFRRGENKALLR